MDYRKEYLLQLLTSCSNRLRLDTAKLELIVLLKEEITKNEEPEDLFRKMKRITEFAKLAIKLNECYQYISSGKIDYQNISRQFSSHIDSLLRDLSPFLDSLSGVRFKEAMLRLTEPQSKGMQKESGGYTPVIDFSAPKGQRILNAFDFQKQEPPAKEPEPEEETPEPVEELLDFAKFESAVMAPIRDLDELLKKMANAEMPRGDISYYSQVMFTNHNLAVKFKSDTVARMHKTVSKALLLIRDGVMKPEKETIESIRACLIVIVAVVRNKDIDFKVYLDNAERFSSELLGRKPKGD